MARSSGDWVVQRAWRCHLVRAFMLNGAKAEGIAVRQQAS
jgi:hypothetical protein